MGSVGSEIFCDILRCKDHIYSSNVEVNKGGALTVVANAQAPGTAQVFSPFAKYLQGGITSLDHLTTGTAFDIGAAETGMGQLNIPGLVVFDYEVVAGAPLLSGASAGIELHLDDVRDGRGFRLVSVLGGTAAGFSECKGVSTWNTQTTMKIEFKNHGASNYIGFLTVAFQQFPINS